MELAGAGIACRPDEGTAILVISSQSASIGAMFLRCDHGSGGRDMSSSQVERALRLKTRPQMGDMVWMNEKLNQRVLMETKEVLVMELAVAGRDHIGCGWRRVAEVLWRPLLFSHGGISIVIYSTYNTCLCHLRCYMRYWWSSYMLLRRSFASLHLSKLGIFL